MSGTSVDAIDCALVNCHGSDVTLIATHSEQIPDDLRAEIANISLPGCNEIERLGVLDRKIGVLFAATANALLATTGTTPGDVRAIGSHGQTIRHRPYADKPFSLQLGNGQRIADLTDSLKQDQGARGDLKKALHEQQRALLPQT